MYDSSIGQVIKGYTNIDDGLTNILAGAGIVGITANLTGAIFQYINTTKRRLDRLSLKSPSMLQYRVGAILVSSLRLRREQYKRILDRFRSLAGCR